MFKSKRYDEETLKHLQKVQTMILKDFINICEKNNLTYFAYGGTLLGAIRHQGFIPWDDDIDVIMFRDDFEKLNKIFETTTDEKYRFINVLNEKTYHYTWGRLFLKDTLLKEWWWDQVDYKPNIYIDIFILDNIPDNKLKRFFHRWSSFILNQLTLYSFIKYDNTSKLKQYIQHIAYYILKIIPVSAYSIKQKCVKEYTKYENEECEEVCVFPSTCFMPIYKKTDWLPPKKAQFENFKVNIPNNCHKVLKRSYGNYMELPPEESRFGPAPEEVDFGKY